MLHGRILLQADATPEGMRYTDEAIAEGLRVSLSTIHRVRQQFVEESFEAALKPRRPRKRPDKVTITGEVEQRIAAAPASRREDTGVGPCVCRQIGWWSWDVARASRETIRQALNDLKLWQVKTWCIPPKANADFVYHMEESAAGLRCPTIDAIPSSVWTKPANN